MTTPRVALITALVLCGLSAGFFYTYEASITVGLAEVDDVTYVATFQALNDNIRNAAFGIMFFGLVPAIGVALALSWHQGQLRRWLIAVGLVLYLTLIAITVAGNVPLNEELANATSGTAASASAARVDFENDWNLLNLARTVAVVGAFVALATAATLPEHHRSDGATPERPWG